MTEKTAKKKKPKKPPVVNGTHLVVKEDGYEFRNIIDIRFEVCQQLDTSDKPPRERTFTYRYKNPEYYGRWTRWWKYPKELIIYDLKEDNKMTLLTPAPEPNPETNTPSISTIAVVDIETTGFQPDVDLIVEIGIVELDLTDGSTIVLFDDIIKEPNFNDSCKKAWVFRNSDLNFDDILEKGKALSDVRETLQIIFDSYYVTAFNSSFDLGYLEHRGFAIEYILPCIMKTSTPILGLTRRGGGPKWPTVEEAWQHYYPEEAYTEKHRAADDAIHEANILYQMCKKNNIHQIHNHLVYHIIPVVQDIRRDCNGRN